MVRTFVMGDIHGAHKALVQCLERSGFDKENDTLIQLGDIADGWSEVYECVDELLTIKNLIAIKGNHDDWFNEWAIKGSHPVSWAQGGEETLISYAFHADREISILRRMGGILTDLTFDDVNPKHLSFFNKQCHYYHDTNNNLVFVHGGFSSQHGIGHEPYSTNYWWDRTLWETAMMMRSMYKDRTDEITLPNRMKHHKEIFIGHTATTNWQTDEEVSKDGIVLEKGIRPITVPLKGGNVWNLDTGAGGRNGKLTIMDVSTHEFWQSDLCGDLYPQEKGRW